MSHLESMPLMLAIGGSDSCGGAGIQADIKTGAAWGVDVATVITAITAQNSLGVNAVDSVQPGMIRAQLDSVCSDIVPDAVKLGMLANAETVGIFSEAIDAYQLRNIVCDPVIVSSSGRELLNREGVHALLQLLPRFALLTPNVSEAGVLTSRNVQGSAGLLDAGRALIDSGANAVLLKGGHLDGDVATDMLVTSHSNNVLLFSGRRVSTRNDHGTGCVLSSAIAANLAFGKTLEQSIESARSFLQSALERSSGLFNGSGRGGMNLVSASNFPRQQFAQ